MLGRFDVGFRKLANQPGIGHYRQDLTDEPFRFWSVGSYLIIYWTDTDPLEILRVMHSSRDIARLLQEE